MGVCTSKAITSEPITKPPPVEIPKQDIEGLLKYPGTILGRPFEDVRCHYTLDKELGRGGLGITYLCTENSTGHLYACKSVLKSHLISKDYEDDIRREVQIMQHLDGQRRIIKFRGAYEDKQYVHIVMELCGGGELFDRIVAKGHYSERAAAKICSVVLNVIQVCHSMGVIHRDLKPENFLFTSNGKGAILKLIDFGLATFIEEGKTHRDIVGSPYYIAPEVLYRNYGKEVDIWSAGVILYILLCGRPPFWAETEQGIAKAIVQGVINFEVAPWPTISSSAKDLVRKMLTQDPKNRITSERALEHRWFREASGKPMDSAVLPRIKQFSAMKKISKH